MQRRTGFLQGVRDGQAHDAAADDAHLRTRVGRQLRVARRQVLRAPGRLGQAMQIPAIVDHALRLCGRRRLRHRLDLQGRGRRLLAPKPLK